MIRPILVFMPVLFGISMTAKAQTLTDSAPILDANDEIIVHGRSLDLIGDAKTASEGVVGYADFEDRPLSRVGELVEVIPGVVATQHSGEGKANQYFLRGFNLDHGTDFSASLDGVPINLRTHGHGQGYLDINFVIPEIIERVDFRKGPYRASTGDFSSAGSAGYSTYDRLENNFIELSLGEFDYLRFVGAGSLNISEHSTLLLAVEANSFDGPWVLEQDLEKFNGFAKLTHDKGPWHFETSVSIYDSQWAATDQVPLRAIETGLIDRFGFIDPDLGGETWRFSLNAQGTYRHVDGAETTFQSYAGQYDFNLFSHFTYFLDDPVNGDEFEQVDKRRFYGTAVTHERYLADGLTVRLGLETRLDDISDVGLFNTISRDRISTVRQDKVRELSLNFWSEAEYELTERLRANVGLRADYFDAKVTAFSELQNSGSANDSLFSPSGGLAWRLTDGVEFYANYGRGFHSNDARGATISVNPLSGLAVDQVPLLVSSEGTELGARLERGPFHATLALFTLDLDSELVFVGDAGTTEANDGSKRKGVEASVFWKPNDWLAADVSGAFTDAEFDIQGPSTEIPGAVKTVFGGGIAAKLEPWTLSGRLRHFGAAPLIEDGSAKSDPTTLVNLAGSYDWKDVTLSLEVLNAFDSKDADITYFFESQLAGEVAPVQDFHLPPVQPRQIRFSAV